MTPKMPEKKHRKGDPTRKHPIRDPIEDVHLRRKFERVPGSLMKHEHPRWQGNGSGEAEVIHGEQLSVILKRWVVEWLAERPLNSPSMGQRVSMQTTSMGPINWLSEKTGIHPRRLQGIINGEFDFVPLSQADALIQACGLTHFYKTGEIQVIANPQWSMERWLGYMEAKRCGD